AWLTAGSFDPLFTAPKPNDLSIAQAIPQAVVGAELATKIGVSVGDTFFMLPASEMKLSQIRHGRVAGIFRSGLFEYASTWIYLPFETVASFGHDEHSTSVMSVQVRDPDHVKQVAARVRSGLGQAYTIVDWQQANQPLFTALALERRMGVFIIGLII